MLCSDFNNKRRLQTLLEQDFVDPWGVDQERRLHVRLSGQQWSKLQYVFPECRVTIDDVEEYVRMGEREMLNNTRLGAGWFEEYVSICTKT